jgi:hypothetical protein
VVREKGCGVTEGGHCLHVLFDGPEPVEIAVGSVVMQVDELSQVNPPKGRTRGSHT